MKASCIVRILLLDAEYSMMFKLSAFVFWVSFYHLNYVHVKSPKQKYLYVNVKVSCNEEAIRK
jgi:hypothetical protein